MANEEHLKILNQGVEVWNKWREEHPEVRPDLAETGLGAANLMYANFSGADLSDSDFNHTKFSYADLAEVNLTDSDLMGADLSEVYLSGAVLRKADLRFANLSDSDLSKADFSKANLSSANLSDSDLSKADFSKANLSSANLSDSDLSFADLTDTQIGRTVFGNVDLSEVKGLDTVRHNGPSTIGIDTIYKSKGNIPEVFLRGVGVPDNLIVYMKSLTGAAFDFYSCFISHSSQDKAFVERLYADLQAKGVRCWYAPENLKIGEPFLLGIDRGIRLHDKLLLVLSEYSVASGWVQHEVLSAMAKEQGKEPWVLFPIRVDDTVLKTNVPWAGMIKQSRHIGDFTHWKDHNAYQQAFDQLLQDLKAEKI